MGRLEDGREHCSGREILQSELGSDGQALYGRVFEVLGREEILGLVAQEVPLLPLMYGPTLVVHRPYVRGFHPPAFGLSTLAHLRLET